MFAMGVGNGRSRAIWAEYRSSTVLEDAANVTLR